MRYIFLIIISIFTLSTGFSQSIEELERSIKKAEQEIANGNKLLKINASKTSDAVNNIVITNNNIKSRERIVSNLNSQLSLIRNSINSNNRNLSSLSKKLRKEQEMYADMMKSAYKRFLMKSNLLFILSSTSLTDFHLRIYYLHKYSNMKRELAESIEKTSGEILSETTVLANKQNKLEQTNKKVENEVSKLVKEKKDYNKLHASLTSESRKIKTTINNNEKIKRNLTKKIAQIIQEENNSRSKKKVSQADIKLSANFASNKGKLPQPIAGGTVVEKFGVHKHPLYPTTVIDNKGVNITAKENSSIKSIFDGEVVRVFFIQGLNNSVMIRHGDYISVYSGLTTVKVVKGDKVGTGDTIGAISGGGANATLHFELHKGKTALNPEVWLR